MNRRPASTLSRPGPWRLAGGAFALAAAAALLWTAGAALPGPGTLDHPEIRRWIEEDPVVAAFAVVRVLGLAVAAWMAVSAAVAVAVHGTRLRRRRLLRRAVDRMCLPAVRRLVHGALGTGLSVVVLAPGLAGGSTTSPPSPVGATAPATAARPASATSPGGIAVMVAPPDASTAGDGTAFDPPDRAHRDQGSRAVEIAELRSLADGSGTADAPSTTTPPTPPMTAPTIALGAPDATRPASAQGHPPSDRASLRSLDPVTAPPPPPAPAPALPAPDAVPTDGSTWVIARGDHLWHVSEATLERQLGTRPDDAAIAAYLGRLVQANRERLVTPDDPDLVFAGQQLVLPPVT